MAREEDLLQPILPHYIEPGAVGLLRVEVGMAYYQGTGETEAQLLQEAEQGGTLGGRARVLGRTVGRDDEVIATAFPTA